MTAPSLPPSWKRTTTAIVRNISNDPGHPLQIALRTYSLCLSLTLSPVLLPTVFSLAVHPQGFTKRIRVLWRALAKELQLTGLASVLTVAVGGGAVLRRLWAFLEHHPICSLAWVRCINLGVPPRQKTFLANVISSTLGVALLRRKYHRRRGMVSPTLDLTLLIFVRALDALVQTFLLRKARQIPSSSPDGAASEIPLPRPDIKLIDKKSDDLAKEWKSKVETHLDTFVFWASSARIMWCFFYQPQRLPSSFVNWINSLANVDARLLGVLRGLREGTWSYIRGSKYNIAGSLAKELGRPPSWGDPTVLPPYGAGAANETWRQLGVVGRNGIGGMPCDLVHGGIGTTRGLQNSCIANATIRTAYAFTQALVLHLPVYFLPILLTRPSSLIRPRRVLSAFLSAIRSATFLSTFVSSCWFMVCFTRTLVLARLFPNISHDVWDGPYGGPLAGSLVCGASIWIENARRRREVALYVLPKALRASIPEKWLRTSHSMTLFAERLTLVLSFASLLTFSVHQPEALRGLSRWTLAFVMKGSNTSFEGKDRKEVVAYPPTDPFISPLADSIHQEN